MKHRLAAAMALAATAALTVFGGTGASAATSKTPAYRWGVVGTQGAITQTQLDTPTVVKGISGEVVQIATSNSDGYALTSTGQVYAWGVNNYGELGDGQTQLYELKAVKVDFPSGVKIDSLANPMPFDGALAIDTHGHAWGWGLNAAGDLCLTGLSLHRPQQIPLSKVTLATGAKTHALFDSNGRVYACGTNEAGELGTGSTTNSAKPTPVVGLPTNAKAVTLTSSWEGSGALFSNGSYYNWGYNAAGQLGNGSIANSDVPVQVKLPAHVRQVFQGGSGPTNGQTVAILSNGSVWSWGDNTRGQLGDGSTAYSDVPVPVDVPAGTRFVTVNSGGYTSYGIDRSGDLWAWGGNQNGQLGTASAKLRQTRPVKVGIHLTQVSSTASNVAGLNQPSTRRS